jgi:chromosome segregation ATPase
MQVQYDENGALNRRRNTAINKLKRELQSHALTQAAKYERAEMVSKLEKEMKADQAILDDTLRQLESEQRSLERARKEQSRGEEKRAELADRLTDRESSLQSLETQLSNKDERIKRYSRKLSRVSTELPKLTARSEELRAMKSADSRRGVPQVRRCTTPSPNLLPASGRTTPTETKYNREGVDPRRWNKEVDQLNEVIGTADIDLLGRSLEETGRMDELMETDSAWRRRVAQGQTLVDKCNATWNADLSTRIKQDWLNSDRDLDGMRLMFSHYIPVTEGIADAGHRPQPRHRVLLSNPHRP